ncbi:MAG TPA: cobalamin-dependent protein, partial [Candidatus Lokiarchaeia archaeon]|nr:cobalamin-dependent protein [Candidatus Lokiarchaeia archaeon]
LHDIGKNIVSTLLTAAGFDVVDLGKDVSAEKIVEVVQNEGADIIALSALLTMTVTEIEKVVKLLEENGLRDKVTIICGGAPLNQDLATRLGADISCDDATEGVTVCRNIMAEKGVNVDE